VERAAIALTNMGATPLRASSAEAALAGGSSVAEAAARIAEGTEPPSDHAASSDFRKHLAQVLGRRSLEGAVA
jgi:carbon-monoxide dehydrogenase medium subunit